MIKHCSQGSIALKQQKRDLKKKSNVWIRKPNEEARYNKNAIVEDVNRDEYSSKEIRKCKKQ